MENIPTEILHLFLEAAASTSVQCLHTLSSTCRMYRKLYKLSQHALYTIASRGAAGDYYEDVILVTKTQSYDSPIPPLVEWGISRLPKAENEKEKEIIFLKKAIIMHKFLERRVKIEMTTWFRSQFYYDEEKDSKSLIFLQQYKLLALQNWRKAIYRHATGGILLEPQYDHQKHVESVSERYKMQKISLLRSLIRETEGSVVQNWWHFFGNTTSIDVRFVEEAVVRELAKGKNWLTLARLSERYETRNFFEPALSLLENAPKYTLSTIASEKRDLELRRSSLYYFCDLREGAPIEGEFEHWLEEHGEEIKKAIWDVVHMERLDWLDHPTLSWGISHPVAIASVVEFGEEDGLMIS